MTVTIQQTIGEIDVPAERIICCWPLSEKLERCLSVDQEGIKITLMHSDNGNTKIVRNLFYTFEELENEDV